MRILLAPIVVRWSLALLAILALAPGAAAAINDEEAAKLVGQAYDDYSRMRSIRLKIRREARSADGKGQKFESLVMVVRPDRLRMEMTLEDRRAIWIADGEDLYFTVEGADRYVRKPQSGTFRELLGQISVTGPGAALLLGDPPLGDVPCRARVAGRTAIDGLEVNRVAIEPLAAGALGAVYPEMLFDFQGTYRGYQVSQDDGAFQRSWLIRSEMNTQLPRSSFIFTPEDGQREVATWNDDAPPKVEWIGKEAPDIRIAPLEGDSSVRLSELRGRPLLIEFWASWSPPCVAALPVIDAVAKLGAGNGLVVVAITSEDAKTVLDFRERRPFDAHVYLDLKDSAANAFEVEAPPVYIAVDAQGIIRGRKTGPTDAAGIEELLATIGVRVDLASAIEAIKPPEGLGAPLSKTGVTRQRHALVDAVSGRLDAAADALYALIEDEPQAPEPVGALAVLLIAADRSGEVENIAAQSLDRFRDSARVLSGLAYILAEGETSLDIAARLANRALELEPDDVSVIDTAAWVEFQTGDHEATIDRLRKISNAPEAGGTVWYHLGRAYEAAGKTPIARNWYRKAIAAEAAPADAQIRLDKLR